MFQFLGIIFTIIIIYILVKSYINAKKRIENEKIATIAQEISTKELNVPRSFFVYTMINNIESIKDDARELHQHSSKKYKNNTWPHLLAWAVFYKYRTDCLLYYYENKTTKKLLKSLNISKETIFKELKSNRFDTALNKDQEREYFQVKLNLTSKEFWNIQKKKDILGLEHPDFIDLDVDGAILWNECEHYIEALKSY